MQICLASTSPARRALLAQSGITPLLRAPDVDEEAVIAQIESRRGAALSIDEHVLLLAEFKARDVAERLAREDPTFDGVVVGGDSMFAFGGAVLGKPHLPAVARERWHAMRGGTGYLHSGQCVVRVRRGAVTDEASATAEASVSFADDLTDAEIEAYIATGEPLEVAGAFTVDGRAAAFITRVEGDPSTVIGLSLSTLRRLVREVGVNWERLGETLGDVLEN